MFMSMAADILAVSCVQAIRKNFRRRVFAREQTFAAVMKAKSPVPDPGPLWLSMSFPFHHVLYPQGFPLLVNPNDSWSDSGCGDELGRVLQRFRETPIESLRFLVSDSPTRRKPPNPLFRAQSNLLTIVADAHNFATCDLVDGFGFACLTLKAAVLNKGLIFGSSFPEAMVYILVGMSHVVALHAACVRRTAMECFWLEIPEPADFALPYACARRGWSMFPDGSWLVLRKPGRNHHRQDPRQAFRFRPKRYAFIPRNTCDN